MRSTRELFGRAAYCGVAGLRRTAQMATVLQTGAQAAVVAVGSTVKTWAGEEMVGLSKADIVNRDFASPLAVAVEFWYPNPDGGRKKDPSGVGSL